MLDSIGRVALMVLCSGSLVLAGCGDDDSGNGSQGGAAGHSAGGQGGGGQGGMAEGGSGGTGGLGGGGGGFPDNAFVVKGVTGDQIVLDRQWIRGCVGGGGFWQHFSRTLTNLELVTTIVGYPNGSATEDCDNGRAQLITFTQVLEKEIVPVPIMWVDPMGAAASAPAGLDAITEANGATALMTVATVTAETQAQADSLNQMMFCGFTDWAVDVAKDVLSCFTGGFNPANGTIIVDDRAMPWMIYDGIGNMLDANGYPTDMPNFAPHAGPFPIQ